MTAITEMLGEKTPRSHAWHGLLGRTRPHKDSQLSLWQKSTGASSHDTLIEGLRLHPEANCCAKRLLADLQTLAFVPECTEHAANVEMEFGDVFRFGSKLNEWFLSLDLTQFRAALHADSGTL